MFKKICAVTVLTTSLLVGGAFQNTADAASNAEQTNPKVFYKVYYNVNGNWGAIDNNDKTWVNKYVQSILGQLSQKIGQPTIEQPKQEQPKQEQSKQEQPKQEQPKQEQPKQEQPKQEQPKQEQPKQEQPKQEQPKQEQPKQEQPKQEQPKQEQPKQEQPKQEQPKQEQPKQEQPKQEQPKQEQPKQEQPKVEQPKAEQPKQPTQPTQPKQEQPAQSASHLSQFEQQVVELTNQERAKHGLAPLKEFSDLSKVAREKSRDMAVNNYFAHNSPTYGSPFDMMQSFGVTYRTAGENIAKGQRSPQEVVQAWMDSPGHRANILNANFTHIGVGYVEQGNHWTQQFIGK